jgi:hypothetical protein
MGVKIVGTIVVCKQKNEPFLGRIIAGNPADIHGIPCSECSLFLIGCNRTFDAWYASFCGQLLLSPFFLQAWPLGWALLQNFR